MTEHGGDHLEKPGDPCTFVIYGAFGDLTKRKLLPSLYNLRCNELLPRDFAIVGVARREMNDAGFREEMTREIHRFATQPVSDEIWNDFRSRLYFHRGDLEDPETYQRLAQRLDTIDQTHHTGGNVLFYLATPPNAFAEVVRKTAAAGLTQESNGRWRRLVVEKPFGRDLETAQGLNETLRKVIREHQIYRIDHYLGKETVQNILVFRFANGIFEPIWDRRYIDHVQITVAEDLGIEGRGATYEQAGTLRDIVQNHMFSLLALVAMEPPGTLAAEAVRNEKTKVLDAIQTLTPEEVLQETVRGQYGEGLIGGAKVPAYRAEPGVSPTSKIETYAGLRLEVENWRWAGVPFYLRSGKRLARRHTVISIQFRLPPLLLFREAGVDRIDPNRLDIHVQPDEAISISMKAKVPGPTIQLKNVQLDFSYKDFGEQPQATGYERLLYDAMAGDSTLFHRADMVEAAWRIVAPIIDVWETLPPRDFPNYPAGSWGPSAGDELIRRDGREWADIE